MDYAVAYWLDNTLYVSSYFAQNVFQSVGDFFFILILMAAEGFAIIGLLLFLIFRNRDW